MRRVKKLIILLGLAIVASPGVAASRNTDLDSWFARDLVPYVRQQLTTHPRFRDEPLRFVVMKDESPQSYGSALALQLRNRLRDSVAGIPGIRVAWQADQPGVGLAEDSANIDCTRGDAHYFIGIELTQDRPGELRVDVRALDLDEREWVAGFNRSWQGTVGSRHYHELRRLESDPTFRGERDAPYSDSETDLMAAHLAYELGCALLGQTAGEYVVTDPATGEEVDPTRSLVQLVSNNLADYRALQLAAADAGANALIEGNAHQIDQDLYQYWITITPKDAGSELPVVSADAYISIPEKYAAITLVPEANYEFPRGETGFLSSLRIVEFRNMDALQVKASDDAVVFFLNHQLNNGLVRLADRDCSRQSDARVARNGEALRYPLPPESLSSDAWAIADNWSLHPDKDTYYVLAATDSKAARALSRHIEQLPRRCGASVRSGLEGAELRHWLTGLESIAAHWKSDIDWQSVRVRNTY